MLRNHFIPLEEEVFRVLNEVLSLNAQECRRGIRARARLPLLNEVLSLNAQECRSFRRARFRLFFLNEVLSLNAQDFDSPRPVPPDSVPGSSMKS